MFPYSIFAAVICLAGVMHLGDCYRILCVFPTPSISHQVVFRGLTLALHERGHELVVVTPDPINDSSLANYIEIDISVDYDLLKRVKYIETRPSMKWIDYLMQLDDDLAEFMYQTLDHQDLRKLHAPESEENFDLLLVEYFHWQAVYSLATRFDVPIIVICLSGVLHLGDCYRILCVFPTPSISHQVVFRGLTLALNKRGHELVVVTPNPINDSSLPNYTEIDIRFDYNLLNGIKFIETRPNMKWIDWLQARMDGILAELTYQTLDHPDLRKLYAPESDEKFDLLLLEYLHYQAIYPLATRFDVPMIGISSFALALNNRYTIGDLILPSHASTWDLESDITEEMSFWQRLRNFLIVWKYLYWYKNTYIAKQAVVARQIFGNDIPDVDDIAKNVSLIFVNQQAPISYAAPQVPKIVHIGGFHISHKTMDLPTDLKKVLDAATNGFIYMSLGSNVRSIILPNKTRNEFVTAFSKLPYEVLWKFEDDVLPHKPDNVHIMKWVPQQAVLAHPNLKVFIYQGGLQSTEEAVHHAVPLIGLPVLWDQDMQVSKMVSLGVAKKLEITTVDGDELLQTIHRVASDTSYKQRMLNLRSLLNDRPDNPLDTAVWWTEYVIRHRGAPHLHSTTADDPWYRRQDMDIVAFISVGTVIVCGLVAFVVHHSIKCIRHAYTITTHIDTKKMD